MLKYEKRLLDYETNCTSHGIGSMPGSIKRKSVFSEISVTHKAEKDQTSLGVSLGDALKRIFCPIWNSISPDFLVTI